MNIPIWDGAYKIKSDTYCYKLVEIRTKEPKDGADAEETKQTEDGVYEVNCGYYSTIEQLFRDLIAKEKRENKCTTLDGFIKHLEKVNNQLEENLNKIAALIGHKKNFERIMTTVVEKQDKDLLGVGDEIKKSVKKGGKKK